MTNTAANPVTDCLDYARARAGFTKPGFAPGSLRHHSGLAELRVIDSEAELQLVIFRRERSRFSKSGYCTVECGHIDLNNVAPDMFAAIVGAAVASLA